MSSEHAELLIGGPKPILRDLGSSNGTFIDGTRVQGEATLRPGAELRFGSVVAILELHQSQVTSVTDDMPAVEDRGQRPSAALILSTIAVLLAGGALALVIAGSGDDDSGVGVATATTATATATTAPPPKPLTRTQVIEQGRNSTLMVKVDGAQAGSGFVVDDRGRDAYVLTNEHVVAGGQTFTVERDGEDPHRADLVSADGCDDLALLRVPDAAGELPRLSFGVEPAVGDDILVLGFPDSAADEPSLQVKRGSVSQLNAKIERDDRPADARYRDLIQIQSAVIPGNSGGPLINEKTARVVGVNTLSEDAAGRETVGYAISSERVALIYRYLRQGKSVPGMSLEFPKDGGVPTVISVASDRLRRSGVMPGMPLTSVTTPAGRRRFSVDLEPSLRGLCGILPEFGDGREESVKYLFKKPDGKFLPATLGY